MVNENHASPRGEDGLPGHDQNGFPQRLQTIIGRSSIRGFARKAGVSDTFLRQCLAGRTEPTRTKLLLLARAGGCSVEWLATGNPSSPIAHGIRDGAGNHDLLNAAVLQSVIESVEEVLAEHGRVLPAGRKAAIITALYERQVRGEHTTRSREDIARLIMQPG